MKKTFLILILLVTAYTNSSFSQLLTDLNQNNLLNKNKKTSPLNITSIPSSGASVGFNLGVASIEGQVGFAIGAFAELKANDFAFVPQANYWNASEQSNFELAGLARFYLSKKHLVPYLDGGLGVNFYNSDSTDFTKLSMIIGGGVELTNLGTSFNLLFDAKYKLIVNSPENISCFIFTVGMKFPFK